MKKRIVIIILTIIAVGISIYVLSEDNYSYESFDSTTQEIYETLMDKYDDVKVVNSVATTYPGNYNDAWADTQYNVVEDNALMPKQIVLLVKESDYYTMISMNYEPKASDNYYTNISYLDHLSEEVDESYNGSLQYYSVGFAVKGMTINVTSFSDLVDDLVLIKRNSMLVNQIQEYLYHNK